MAAEFLKKHGFDLNAELAKVHFGSEHLTRRQDEIVDERLDTNALRHRNALRLLAGVKLPRKPLLWDIHIANGRIAALEPHNFNGPSIAHQPGVLEGNGRLIAPSLCHAHIHLDKCFLLQDPKFSDLEIIKGDFAEAMELTTKAKTRFSRTDLMRRGRQLVTESIQAGVTAMRAFVEVDGDVDFKCLDAGLALKKEFAERCEIQICAFAQLPLFSGKDDGIAMRKLMEEACKRDGVDVLGSTPYVEEDEEKEKMNVEWITRLALKARKYLDMHLDYHLDQNKEPMIWSVLNTIKNEKWIERGGKKITLGHCTRLTFLQPDEWERLAEEIGQHPVAFVGLPTSDLFMMRTDSQYRGSLHVPEMIGKYGLQAAIGVNNVGNAFTPQGNCDPLMVASLGVGLYSAGTKGDADLLYECVSSRAKQAIGYSSTSLDLRPGEPADFVLFEKAYSKLRSRKSISEVIYDPSPGRVTIRNGVVTNK